MKLLVLGGTIFLGRHIVQEALEQGHEVTIFNRGQHFPEVFPTVDKLCGDRGGDISALEEGRWDAVIDTSGHLPRDVRATARLLADQAEHYTFVSSINVYPDYSIMGIDESTPVATLEDENVDQMTFENYGALKAACERVAEEEMPGRVCSIRPGLIVGAYDFSDRFTYWPHRIAAGGVVLAPGNPERSIQIIDVRDLARWCVQCAVEGITGTFNATGPERRLSMGEMLATCCRASGNAAELVWADDSFLVEQEVGAWVEMPLWLPEGEGTDGLCEIDCRRAIDAGLTFRPLVDTVTYTLAWDATRPPEREMRAGLKPEREKELLEKWAATQA